ncbi:ribosome biogenesis protein Nop53/GLTSCR2 [Powellomyces hirtus]|nr:ribosome biogenesis protein Nop53/GLTSCR2 [Powellomyces hirtus]
MAPPNGAAVNAKKQQPGRKGKKAWRKNVDTTQVEEQLHELRTEERLGGKLHMKADSDLFFTDKSGDAKVQRKYKYGKLRIDEILTPTSGFSGITSRKTAKTTVEIKKSETKIRKASKSQTAVIENLSKRKLELGVGRVGATAEIRKQQAAIKKRKLDHKKGGFDLWAVTDATSSPSSDPIAADLAAYLEPTVVKPVKKPKFADTRPSAIPAVEITHSGASYNPSFDAHQEALQRAVQEEEFVQEKKSNAAKQLAYPAELDNLDDETFFDDSDDEEEEEGEKEGGESAETEQTNGVTTPTTPSTTSLSLSVGAPVVESRKTRAQRNKLLKRAEQQRAELALKQAKQLDKQLNRLGELTKIVSKEEKLHAARLTERAQQAQKLADEETRRLGPHAFKPLPMDVQLTEDLADTLRELKPEGNMFKDRFASLQKRTLIEARIPVTRKLKYRRKEKETHDYKRFK